MHAKNEAYLPRRHASEIHGLLCRPVGRFTVHAPEKDSFKWPSRNCMLSTLIFAQNALNHLLGADDTLKKTCATECLQRTKRAHAIVGTHEYVHASGACSLEHVDIAETEGCLSSTQAAANGMHACKLKVLSAKFGELTSCPLSIISSGMHHQL